MATTTISNSHVTSNNHSIYIYHGSNHNYVYANNVSFSAGLLRSFKIESVDIRNDREALVSGFKLVHVVITSQRAASDDLLMLRYD